LDSFHKTFAQSGQAVAVAFVIFLSEHAKVAYNRLLNQARHNTSPHNTSTNRSCIISADLQKDYAI